MGLILDVESIKESEEPIEVLEVRGVVNIARDLTGRAYIHSFDGAVVDYRGSRLLRSTERFKISEVTDNSCAEVQGTETGVAHLPVGALQRLLQCELALLRLVSLRRLKQAGAVKSYKAGKAEAWEEAYRLADGADEDAGDMENI